MEGTKSKKTIKVVHSESQKNYISDRDAEMDTRAVEAVRAAVSKAAICKKPIAKYDAESKNAYVEYPNGRRVYVR